MASDSDLDLKFLITILMMKMKSKPDLPRGQNYAGLKETQGAEKYRTKFQV